MGITRLHETDNEPAFYKLKVVTDILNLNLKPLRGKT